MNQEYEDYLQSEKYAEHLRHIEEIERMLKGNINRMCVTDDPQELYSMQRCAKKFIDQIAETNIQRLRDSGLYKKA